MFCVVTCYTLTNERYTCSLKPNWIYGRGLNNHKLQEYGRKRQAGKVKNRNNPSPLLLGS